MSYFFYTLFHGFRLYIKSSFYLAAFSIIFFLPTSYLFFEFNLDDILMQASVWVTFDLFGLQNNATSRILLYCLAGSIVYIPASIWVACCTTTCLALSNGYYPKFKGIVQTTFSSVGSILIARFFAQCIVMIPALIISLFTSKFAHILPMYGAVIIPAIAYFTLYLSLRYTFVEVIVIAERVNPFQALSLCSKVTDGATLKIFLLQQAYLVVFVLFNWAAYKFIDSTFAFSGDTTRWLAATLLGTINTYYLVITYYIYLSCAVGETYSNLEGKCDEIFGDTASYYDGD